MANCDVRVYEKKKPVQNEWWYRLNYEPNINQSAKAFWQKLIHRLYEDNEALVVEINGQIFIADSFIKNLDTALYEHSYTGVMIDNYQFEKTFYEHEVWYFKLHDADIKLLSDQVTSLYGQLIQAFSKSYIGSKGAKGILYVDQVAEQAEDFEQNLNNIINEDFKNFYQANDAVMPLFDGFKYDPLTANQNASSDSSEVRAQVQAIFETYAMAFGIPKHLITGDVEDTTEAVESFLTFTLDPLVKVLESEINRKEFKKKTKDGYYLRFKTNEIKHIDILTVASNIEKLISSGAMTINEVRKALGMDGIEDDFANRLAMTKNFADVSEVLKPLERRINDIEREINIDGNG